MKIQTSRHFFAKLAIRRCYRAAKILPLVVALCAVHSAHAATLGWDGGDANGTNGANGGTGTWDLNTTANFYPGTGTADVVWSDSTGTADTASFGGTAGTVTLGSALGAQGLVFTTTGYTIGVTGATNVLTLGTGGLDASALTSGTTTINEPLTLLANRLQNWSVGAGATLQVNGATTVGSLALVNYNVGTGGAINMAAGTASTGLIYGTLNSNDFAALDANKNVVSLNTVSAYTQNPNTGTAAPNQGTVTSVVDVVNQNNYTGGVTAFRLGSSSITLGGVRFNATSTADWVVDFGGSTNNRVLNILGTPGILVGSGVNHNVIFQNAGTSGIRSGGGTNYFRNFSTTNDLILNVPITQSGSGGALSNVFGGTGRIIIGVSGNNTTGTNSIDGATLQIGNAGTVGAIGTGAVINNGILQFNRTDPSTAPNTFANVVSGTGSLTQVGTGFTSLSGASSFTGAVNVNAGTLVANLGNNSVNPATSALGNPQVARNINVNNGGTLQFALGDTLGGATSTIASTLVINAGGIVTNAGTNFNTLGAVTLNGGTLTGTGGATATYQMYSLRGTVTVGGTSASTISGTGTNAGYHLAAPTVFNVGTTGAAGGDLTVSATLIDQTASQNSAAGALTKTGTGTLTLAAANTYTGATNVNAGTLLLSTGSVVSTAVNVTSTGALTLQNATALADNSTLTLSLLTGTATAVNLDAAAGTSEVIGGLVVNGTAEAAGTYTAAQLNSFAGATLFESANGETLTIGAVPEPSTYVGGVFLLVSVVGWSLRRRYAAGKSVSTI